MTGKINMQKYYMRAKRSRPLYDASHQKDEPSTSSGIRTTENNAVYLDSSSESGSENELSVQNLQCEETAESPNFTDSMRGSIADSSDTNVHDSLAERAVKHNLPHAFHNVIYLDTSSESGSENELSVQNLQCEETAESPNFTDSMRGSIADNSDTIIRDSLAEWAVKHNVTHTAINDLLPILQKPIPHLPKDARTLLKTCRNNIITKQMEPGKYFHFGLRHAILKLCEDIDISSFTDNRISINVNIDGLSLSKSSNSEAYPILCCTAGYKNVEMIGIYHGCGKPKDVNSFLFNFVEEAVLLINNGLLINEHLYHLHIKAFICDSPAKAFIKCVTYHTGYNSCTKCLIEGDYIADRVCFPSLEPIACRTDVEFRTKGDNDHHTGTSILERIPNFDMIKSFPLDYMHLICCGVMKKLLVNLWCCGKPSTKICYSQFSIISNLLLSLRKCIPLEFNRKPRGLNELKRWKATEFRQFLLYTGPVVLLKNISRDKYENFLSLHVAVTILSNSKYFDAIEYASQLLNYFVKTFKILYGDHNVSHNVHNLVHLTEDVKHHGPLDNFSAYIFENFLQSILKLIRQNDEVLEQLVKRHTEKCNIPTKVKVNF
ncbi:uncharacterized protein LOC143218425 [Lasioglossum baleicum]|uniref:uncharacterized protein LOC143218425 n=1 Tax=Lasioglossum baleicum TaxID=434251 RepID=UPI003FCCA765